MIGARRVRRYLERLLHPRWGLKMLRTRSRTGGERGRIDYSWFVSAVGVRVMGGREELTSRSEGTHAKARRSELNPECRELRVEFGRLANPSSRLRFVARKPRRWNRQSHNPI